MLVGMVLARLTGMVRGMQRMPVRDVGVIRGFFVVVRLMMVGRLTVVPRGMLMVLGCFEMMFCSYVSHSILLNRIWNDNLKQGNGQA
jgi:hypothetical protein